MFCKYCGNRLEDGDRFCGACGHLVEEKPMQETANEDSYKKQEEKVPHIKKKKPEPEYDNRMTEGMGYGYQMEQHPEDDDDDDEEEWEREEKKEKITFAILGIIIVVLVVAIVFGVVKLVGAGSGDTKKVPQLNEQMKEDMQKIQDRDEKDTEESEDASVADETVKEPETVTPEVTATPEPTQETSPAQEAETTVEPTQQVTPEPTQEAAVQEQHREAEVNDAETASDTENSDYVIPDSSTRYLTNTDLTGLSEWQMRIARNEIYARHGRIFKSDDLADYFASKSWYTPSVSADQFDNSYLNAIEIENLKLITAYEKAHNLNQ